MSKWIWYCPVQGCEARGTKGVSHTNAKHHGYVHLHRFHDDKELSPEMIRVDEIH